MAIKNRGFFRVLISAGSGNRETLPDAGPTPLKVFQ